MTWPEIKEALVRRWPEKFELYKEPYITAEEPDGYGIQTVDTGIPYFATELSDIAAICEAIGAVVESRFCVETGKKNRVLWGWTMCLDVNAKYPRLIGSAKKTYDSRESAELAALGEWLKATEVDNG